MTQFSRSFVWVAAGTEIIQLSTDLEEKGRFVAHTKQINQLTVLGNQMWSCSDDASIAIWNEVC